MGKPLPRMVSFSASRSPFEIRWPWVLSVELVKFWLCSLDRKASHALNSPCYNNAAGHATTSLQIKE